MKAATVEYPGACTVREAAGRTRELDEDDHVTECARRRDYAIAAVGAAFGVVNGRTRDVGILPGEGEPRPCPRRWRR